MSKKPFFLFSVLCILTSSFAYSQDEIKYYHKIWDIVKQNNSAEVILKKIDSIEQTRRLQQSKVSILYNRNVDFGFTHEKIAITFNNFPYMVNLLLKNYQVIFASINFNATILGAYSQFNKYREVKIDTILCQQYLNLHNKYYNDDKTINDIVEELGGVDMYAIFCGDGNTETPESKHIDTLARKKNIHALNHYLKSLSCEQQAYGVIGFARLKNLWGNIPAFEQKLIDHIVNRRSELIECGGCIVNVVKPITK